MDQETLHQIPAQPVEPTSDDNAGTHQGASTLRDDSQPSTKRPRKRHFRLWTPKILDRYILRKFLGTYFVATLLVLAVIAMFDVTEKLDAFLTAPVSETIFDYFTSFLPYFAVQLSPLFVFIAVIFFTSKLAGNSEIIAMLSAGVSYRRLLVPYMIGAAVIAGLTFWLSNYAIPPSNVKRLEYTNKYVKNKKVTAGTNIQLQVQPGVIAFMGRYESVDHTGYRFSLDKFNDKQLVSHLTARSITYDTTAVHKWKIKDYMIRQMDGMKESITKGDRIDTTLFMEPADFLIMKNQQEMLTSPQLSEYINRQRQRGFANIKEFEIEYHKRIAMSFASFILTLIGVSLSSKKTKGGMGLHLGIGLALSFSYILFQTIASTFAVNGNMPPVIAVWIPNIMYAFIAFYLYRKAPK